MCSRRSALFGALTLLAALLLAACGGSSSAAAAEVASCTITPSALGPFSPETTLGSSMTEDQARAQMANDDIIGWLEVSATGPWDTSWDIATQTLGDGIHVDLTWLDVGGELRGLYEADDAFEFTDLRVSRSFQGKIEHSTAPVYLPLQVAGSNADPACVITSLDFEDATNDQLLSVFAETPLAP